jgi:hypothetical protein
MTHVLVLITVFTASNGVHSQTRFQEFASKPACEVAAAAIRDAMTQMEGTLGRKVIAQCHALK